jgi:hypothetical protein
MNLRYPERLLQPFKDLRQFTQELYAMFKDGDQADVQGGIDVGRPPREPDGLQSNFDPRRRPERFELPEAPRRRERTQAEGGPPRFEAPARRPREPQGRVVREPAIEERRQQAAQAPRLPEPPRRRERPIPIAPDEPARGGLTEPPLPTAFRDRRPAEDAPRRPLEPLRPEPKRHDEGHRRGRKPVLGQPAEVDYPTPSMPSAGGGGTTIFIGQVVSHDSSGAQVTLYPDGPDNDPGDDVTVTIQDLDPEEKLDAETWLYSIFELSDADGNKKYYCKPPMWVN